MADDTIRRLRKKIELGRLAARTDLWVLNQSMKLGVPTRGARVLGLQVSTITRVIVEQRAIRDAARSV